MGGAVPDHDRVAAVPDQDARSGLIDALSGLHLQGALFLHGMYTEGWAYRSSPVEDIAALMAPGARSLLLFHLISEGRCWVTVGDGERHWAEAGDVVVLPYGDVHTMGGSKDAVVVDVETLITPPPDDEMPYIQHGEGGARTHVVCGYMRCDAPLFDPQFRAFPPVFVVRPDEPAAGWVRASIDYAAGQVARDQAGTFQAPTVLPELLLREVLTMHLASAPAGERGFVRALNDPLVAHAMGLIHAAPERKWTVADLAGLGNVSVSLLDERFRRELGMAPIRYLTGWRMHLAQDLLTSTDLGLVAIARRIGYESEEAFSRAFKRLYGESPSVWRVRR
ncbi:MAG: AraC family transcriptional regulator [Marmoricola sp.]|nr:AraC family transcriptional regulator [Marmoricola sp.]